MSAVREGVKRITQVLDDHAPHLNTRDGLLTIMVGLRHYCTDQGFDFYDLMDESYIEYLEDMREERT